PRNLRSNGMLTGTVSSIRPQYFGGTFCLRQQSKSSSAEAHNVGGGGSILQNLAEVSAVDAVEDETHLDPAMLRRLYINNLASAPHERNVNSCLGAARRELLGETSSRFGKGHDGHLPASRRNSHESTDSLAQPFINSRCNAPRRVAVRPAPQSQRSPVG